MAKSAAAIACYNLCIDFLISKNLHRTVTTMKSESGSTMPTHMTRQHLVSFLRLDTTKAGAEKSPDVSILERLVENVTENDIRSSTNPRLKTAGLDSSRGRREGTDLLIEDNIESESFLGRGLDGVMDQPLSLAVDRPPGKMQKAPMGRAGQKAMGGRNMMASGGLMDDQFSRRNQRPSSGRTSARMGAPRQPDVVDLLSRETSQLKTEEPPSRVSGGQNSEVPAFLQPTSPPVPLTAPTAPNSQSAVDQDQSSSFNRILMERKARMADKLSRGRQNWSEFDNLRGDRVLGKRTSIDDELVKTDTPASVNPPDPQPPERLNKPARHPPSPRLRTPRPKQSRPLDLQTAVELKSVIHGSANLSFNDEWRLQSFCFVEQPTILRYGIVQKKGGPCGVLAAVQAEVIRELLFGAHGSSGDGITTTCLRTSASRRSMALAQAIARILWRCGDKQRAILAVPSMRNQYQTTPKCRSDGITETLELYEFDSFEDLEDSVSRSSSQFEMDSSPGVVLLLYSALLSRGIRRCIADMDNANTVLMAAHGYCSQEMVNLIIFGRCVSNVFNDCLEVDGMQLKGVPSRTDIGLLSLHEHYKSCEVGSFYKTPRYPIWLICAESHFSVLFSLRSELVSDWKAERRFDLFYYDGLARQDEEIRLTIDNTRPDAVQIDDDDLQPPLELCIRTKWPDSLIDWNGTDPLL